MDDDCIDVDVSDFQDVSRTGDESDDACALSVSARPAVELVTIFTYFSGKSNFFHC